jgi:hypothetical protein
MKKIVIVGAAVVVLLLAVTVPALAKAKRTPLYNNPATFTCPGGATDTTVGKNGFVVVNVMRKGMLQIEVSLKRASPKTTYDVWVNQDPGGCPLDAPTFPAALTTNVRGNGNAHFTVPILTGATEFWVSVTSSGGEVYRSVAVP